MIISLQNQKGGVGKTTLSVHIAHVLVMQQRKVLLVDGDPQGSARDWAAARQQEPLFPVMALDRPILHKELPSIAEDYDDVIIDGPPRVTDLARSAILAADLVVIPITPSPYDVWAAQEIVNLVNEAETYKQDLMALFVVNRKISNSAIGRDVYDALSEYNIPTLKNSISQRVSFAESAAAGMTVIEQGMTNNAAKEIISMVEEIQSYVQERIK